MSDTEGIRPTETPAGTEPAAVPPVPPVPPQAAAQEALVQLSDLIAEETPEQ